MLDREQRNGHETENHVNVCADATFQRVVCRDCRKIEPFLYIYSIFSN